MTTTHTQPAGCDLDSLQRFNNRGGLMNPEANGLYVRFEDAARAAQAQQGDTRQVAPVDYVLMPKRLTAENGAKGALSGEFKESIRVTCHECDGSGEGETDDGNCAECKGDGTVDAAVTVSWDTIKDIYKAAVALLATQAAHTCTPADERARREQENSEFTEWWNSKQACPEHSITTENAAHAAWQERGRRAAQGAGTAPVQVQTDAWGVEYLPDTKWAQDHDGRVELMSRQNAENICINKNYRAVPLRVEIYRAATHPAPVSTAPSKSPEFEGIGDVPVSTAAATTASASEPKAVQIFTCNGKGGEYELIGYSNGAGPKRGESIVVYRRTSEPDVLYHRSTDDFRERMEWLGGRAPSRAADGQQGASRAALSMLDGLPTYDPERDMAGVMEFRDKCNDGDYYKVEDVRAALARNLPAQGEQCTNGPTCYCPDRHASAPLPAQADGQAVDDARDAGDQNG